MPIEQLLAMYYQNGDQEATTEPPVKTENKGTSHEITKSDVDVENQMNGEIDESDPFQNQRITRGCEWYFQILFF